MKTANFIQKAKKIHGDKYDYSKTIYVHSLEKLIVTCPIHGDFHISPNKHLNGRGCPICGTIRTAEAHKLSVTDFIEKAKEKHGDKYDYSLIKEFNGVRNKVKIICSKHGIFEQQANSHLRGSGCPECAAIENGYKPLTTKEFIEKAREKHGDKYDYSLAEYFNNRTYIKIICPKHGIFEQQANGHLNGQGCPKCAAEKRSIDYRTDLKDFIAKANIIHDNKYDYSLVKEFGGVCDKIKIICPKHGIFEQQANSHLCGSGCPLCNGGAAFTLEKFIIKAKEKHGDKYDYSLIKEFNGVKNKVKIICPLHGEFEQTARKHLEGSGCLKCAFKARYDKTRLTTEEFIEKAKKIHGDKYDYSLVNYINNRIKVKIICPVHGIFEQQPGKHLFGHGCRKCTSHISKQEKEVLEFIKSFYDGEIIENDRVQIKPKELDIFIPKLKFAIEYNGEYWHKLQEERDPGYHERKYKECRDKGINLLVIWHENWAKDNEKVKKLIKDEIKNLII